MNSVLKLLCKIADLLEGDRQFFKLAMQQGVMTEFEVEFLKLDTKFIM